MSYIGNTSTTQAFTPAVDFFNGNGSTTAFTLSRPVASVAQVQVVISNVPQKPGDAFTVSGNTITFTSAPPSGTQNIYVYYTSPITQVIAPGQGTVGTAQLQDGAVITQDIADGAVTPAKLSTGAPTWTSAGKLLVGASSSDLTATSQAMIIGSGGLAVQNGGSTGTFLKITPGVANGTVDISADARSGNYPAMTFYTSATERARILSTGGTQFNYGISVGGTAPATEGSGVKFPATQVASSDANTLDDYEEGTWTGTITASGTAPTTPATATGYYTKIGNLVTVRFTRNSFSMSGSSGYMIVTGLPFTSRNSTGNTAVGSCVFFNVDLPNGSNTLAAVVNENTSQVLFYASIDNASYSNVTDNSTTTGRCWFTVTYEV